MVSRVRMTEDANHAHTILTYMQLRGPVFASVAFQRDMLSHIAHLTWIMRRARYLRVKAKKMFAAEKEKLQQQYHMHKTRLENGNDDDDVIGNTINRNKKNTTVRDNARVLQEEADALQREFDVMSSSLCNSLWDSPWDCKWMANRSLMSSLLELKSTTWRIGDTSTRQFWIDAVELFFMDMSWPEMKSQCIESSTSSCDLPYYLRDSITKNLFIVVYDGNCISHDEFVDDFVQSFLEILPSGTQIRHVPPHRLDSTHRRCVLFVHGPAETELARVSCHGHWLCRKDGLRVVTKNGLWGANKFLSSLSLLVRQEMLGTFVQEYRHTIPQDDDVSYIRRMLNFESLPREEMETFCNAMENVLESRSFLGDDIITTSAASTTDMLAFRLLNDGILHSIPPVQYPSLHRWFASMSQ